MISPPDRLDRKYFRPFLDMMVKRAAVMAKDGSKQGRSSPRHRSVGNQDDGRTLSPAGQHAS